MNSIYTGNNLYEKLRKRIKLQEDSFGDNLTITLEQVKIIADIFNFGDWETLENVEKNLDKFVQYIEENTFKEWPEYLKGFNWEKEAKEIHLLIDNDERIAIEVNKQMKKIVDEQPWCLDKKLAKEFIFEITEKEGKNQEKMLEELLENSGKLVAKNQDAYIKNL